MRHRKHFRKLNRSSSHRRAMFRNLSTSLILNGSIRTTVQKAKEVRPIVEKIITAGKEDNLHARRKAYSYLMTKSAVDKLFLEIGPKFKETPGGYLRILKTDFRPGDKADMAIIEFVQ